MTEWTESNRTVRRKADDAKGGALRLGTYAAMLAEGSQVADIYGGIAIEERHRHRYEVDIQYRERLEEKGLRFSGMSPDVELPEIVEMPDHPWYIGVQFHPELKSKPFDRIRCLRITPERRWSSRGWFELSAPIHCPPQIAPSTGWATISNGSAY